MAAQLQIEVPINTLKDCWKKNNSFWGIIIQRITLVHFVIYIKYCFKLIKSNAFSEQLTICG